MAGQSSHPGAFPTDPNNPQESPPTQEVLLPTITPTSRLFYTTNSAQEFGDLLNGLFTRQEQRADERAAVAETRAATIEELMRQMNANLIQLIAKLDANTTRGQSPPLPFSSRNASLQESSTDETERLPPLARATAPLELSPVHPPPALRASSPRPIRQFQLQSRRMPAFERENTAATTNTIATATSGMDSQPIGRLPGLKPDSFKGKDTENISI